MISTQKSDKTANNEASEFAWFWKEFNSCLLSKQLKQTQQRKLIVETFLSAGGHISAEELHDVVKKNGHSFGLATIYRTLNLLTEVGLAQQRTFSEAKAVFEVLNPEEHHDHLICTDCGKVVEFENQVIENLQTEIAENLGFKLTDHRLELFASCQKSQCPNKNKN
jgi:Fur family ferric uptake transcriptional regulator